MLTPLPNTVDDFMHWTWEQIQPYYQELSARPLDAASLDRWLADWTHLSELVNETFQRLYVATTTNTADEEIDRRYAAFLEHIYPFSQASEQDLKVKLLDSGLQPAGFSIPLRNIRLEVDLFCEANLPLLAQEMKHSNEYDKIVGAQTVAWEGQEVTLVQLNPLFLDPERGRREAAWRLAASRRLADRAAIDALWIELMALRGRLAENAGLPDYLAYRWQQLLRYDYSPEDSARFHAAIGTAVVPAVRRMDEKRRQRLGLEALRPWDVEADPSGLPPLQPFKTAQELVDGLSSIFHRVDPQLGEYFNLLRRENLLDLENRKNKAPGAYSVEFPLVRRPFIFANTVGTHEDVQAMFHESGHAFHTLEAARLPYYPQRQVPMEFAEVASMGMELLAAPYLTADAGGFYAPQEAARALSEHLQSILRFWPYMAVVDAFQHWVYTHHQVASQPANCDAAWDELWQRFMPGEDWTGLEAERMTGWQRKLHILQAPLYYIEYGLAQLGAVQVWSNALHDQAGAVAAYRRALALGGTVSLPDLFAAAGAHLAFDAATLQQAVDLLEEMIDSLEAQARPQG